MSKFVEAGKKGELAEGKMKKVTADGREILLARVGDRFYAVDNKCPHMGGNLSEGKLEGTIVTCPLHGSQFDLSDGHVIRWTNFPGLVSSVAKIIKRPRPLKTYAVKLEGDKILIEV
jgi:3-phenylpropionate/trans-cinnamate dioxygenase ferredoxin component